MKARSNLNAQASRMRYHEQQSSGILMYVMSGELNEVFHWQRK
jgi:hypothetical protein